MLMSCAIVRKAIAAPDQAMEATAKHLAEGAEARAGAMSVVRKLSSREIAALGLRRGEVKPALRSPVRKAKPRQPAHAAVGAFSEPAHPARKAAFERTVALGRCERQAVVRCRIVNTPPSRGVPTGTEQLWSLAATLEWSAVEGRTAQDRLAHDSDTAAPNL
jgi:hypothetical protein